MTRSEKGRQKGNFSGKHRKVRERHVIDDAIEAPVDSVTFALSHHHVDSTSVKIEEDRNSSINEAPTHRGTHCKPQYVTRWLL